MMLLAHPAMESVLPLSGDRVCTLVIENPTFFRSLLQDISAQLQGGSGSTVLSRDDVPLRFAGNAELIDSLLSFEISRKSLITKLTARIEALAVSESHYLSTAMLLGELEQHIHRLCFELPCDVLCSRLTIGSVLKAVGPEIPDDYDNDLERLLDYMELTRELDRDKLFIFVNLRSFYGDEEVEAFLRSALAHEYRLLLVDSVSREKLPVEHRITVDCDLCEF